MEVTNNRTNQKKHHKKIKKEPKTSIKSSFPSEDRPVIQNQIEVIVIQDQEIDQQKQSSIPVKNRKIIWENLPNCIMDQQTVMIVGQKNTGKSTLIEHIYQERCAKQTVIIDCDIGRNMALDGCISFMSDGVQKSIFIGEVTPMNCIPTYLKAIEHLFKLFRDHHFSKKLIINTMGYLSGVGELLIYEIFNIIKPQNVILMSKTETQNENNPNYSISNIKNALQSQDYINRLHLSSSIFEHFDRTKATCKLLSYRNEFADKKENHKRFQKHFLSNPTNQILNIQDLLHLIYDNQLKEEMKPNSSYFSSIKVENIKIYEQSHRKGINMLHSEYKRAKCADFNFRIILIGSVIKQQSQKLFKNTFQNASSLNDVLIEIHAVGFCLNNKIYYQKKDKQFEITEECIGIINENIDFEKAFYQLTETQVINLQMKFGRIPYISIVGKALGSKGVRNNPSKRF